MVSMHISFENHQDLPWPWMVLGWAKAMDATSGRQLVCENYANGMRKFLNIGSKFEFYSKFTKILSGSLVNLVFRYVSNKLKLEVR